jgi:pimeloyl-ACP methyl ester carboxylesterase
MKLTIRITCILLLLILIQPAFSQEKAQSIGYFNNAGAGHFQSVRGFKMYYELYGKGEPLLLLHGNGGSIQNFKNQIPYFAKQYKVIAVDSRAQGKSKDFSDSLSYEMMADDFNALLDSLHIDSAYVIGWSDGGINGLLLAIRHPKKVKKLAISGANIVPDTNVFTKECNEMFDQDLKKLRAATQDSVTKNEIKLLNLMKVAPNIPLTDLHKIKCPVLVMAGDHDAIKVAHTVKIYENIQKAYLYIFPAAGHATPHRFKDDFNSKVLSFFKHPYTIVHWDDWDK